MGELERIEGMTPDRLAFAQMACISESLPHRTPAPGAARGLLHALFPRARTVFATAMLGSVALPALAPALLGFCAIAPRLAHAAPAGHGASSSADSPAELIGKPARAWTFTRWVNGGPLTQEQLRGKVVLVRWYTSGCRYCTTTLPTLEQLRKQYASQGLVVVGVYHPKPPGATSDRTVRDATRQLGFGGPVALDQDWSTLNRWWLMNHPDRSWTSVSFLIDRDGIVRWGQGGGEYHPSDDPDHAACNARHAELERSIRQLLGTSSAAR